jgi:hypothetical protein
MIAFLRSGTIKVKELEEPSKQPVIHSVARNDELLDAGLQADLSGQKRWEIVLGL